MDDLKGKKLLILGGNRPSVEIVKEAKSMGVYTIVTDWYDTQRSPAKLEADEYWNEEVFRPDLLAELVKENSIEGIITGYTDSYLLPYLELCERVNLPHWGDFDNMQLSVDKQKFKEACELSHVSVVPWRILNREDYETYIDEIEVPVVIKPADNSGSRGVYKCYEKSHFKELCEQSFGFSQTGKILIERMMNPNTEFSVYYIMNHGEIYLTAMGDRYVYEISNDIAPVGQGMLFPSTHLKQWINEIDPVIKQFFRNNRMNDGFVFVQGFYEDNQFYIHEIGYRLNGGFSFKLVEYFTHYNQVQQLERFALTGNMDTREIAKSDPFFGGGIGMIFTATLQCGTIAKINGVEDIRNHPFVYEFYQLKEIGSIIASKGTTAEAFAYIMLTAPTTSDLKTTINDIKSKLVVLDEAGNNMLIPMVDPERLAFYESK